MRIGLNNFLRFISATGLSKVNQVVEALQDYRDWKDYYKEFRELAIVSLATKKTDRLRKLIASLPDDTKAHHYGLCLDGFEQWLERTDYKIISHPKGKTWQAGEIRISVNPEVILEIEGVRYIVKLYLSKERLSQPARRAYAWLLGETHGHTATPATLEVRRGKLTPIPPPTNRIGQWIHGEIAAFIALWKMNKAA